MLSTSLENPAWISEQKNEDLPRRRVTGHIVGFPNIDNRGLSGFERNDKDLTERIFPLPEHYLRVQHLMYQALRTLLKRFEQSGNWNCP